MLLGHGHVTSPPRATDAHTSVRIGTSRDRDRGVNTQNAPWKWLGRGNWNRERQLGGSPSPSPSGVLLGDSPDVPPRHVPALK